MFTLVTMANMTGHTKNASDNYETPPALLDLVLDRLPKRLTIWDPFWLNGSSGTYMRSKGFKVIHENKDFFTYTPDHYNIIVSNPPYSKRKNIFKRLKELGKPWAMLVPLNTLANKYLHDHFTDIKVILPKTRTGFIKNGRQLDKPNFEICWLLYKIKLGRSITYA